MYPAHVIDALEEEPVILTEQMDLPGDRELVASRKGHEKALSPTLPAAPKMGVGIGDASARIDLEESVILVCADYLAFAHTRRGYIRWIVDARTHQIDI